MCYNSVFWIIVGVLFTTALGDHTDSSAHEQLSDDDSSDYIDHSTDHSSSDYHTNKKPYNDYTETDAYLKSPPPPPPPSSGGPSDSQLSDHQKKLSIYDETRSSRHQMKADKVAIKSARLNERSAELNTYVAYITERGNHFLDLSDHIAHVIQELDEKVAVKQKVLSEIEKENAMITKIKDKLALEIMKLSLRQDELAEVSAYLSDEIAGIGLEQNHLNGKLVHLTSKLEVISRVTNEIMLKVAKLGEKSAELDTLNSEISRKINTYAYMSTYHSHMSDYFTERNAASSAN
eukprot:TRINITY_DN1208_c0_g1_i1.p1 TRINITY_DN1208_c0_g1~~TRINITY_DN1208_c0_g1_i1.p1  ORF type:complete len:291 (-),score=60.42 TRINITY_DN1208_c0_g1_i1:75-947(-)